MYYLQQRSRIVNEEFKIQRQLLFWLSQNKTQPSSCLISKVDETKLWNQKLGHLNLNSMKKIISEDAIRGFSKIKIEEGKICEECQIGK